MDQQEELHQSITKGARLIGAVFGCIFAGIGLLVLGFLWLQPFGGFGSPALFFRLFGSFIAIAFVATGSIFAHTSITGINMRKKNLINSSSVNQSQGSCSCPKCNAPLSNDVDVSPHGDVKCGYCNSWFNIHHG